MKKQNTATDTAAANWEYKGASIKEAGQFQEIDLHSIQTKKVQDGCWGDGCILCGKPVGKNPASVHYTTNGKLTTCPDDEMIDDSQGSWPIGSECAKKLPAGFVFT